MSSVRPLNPMNEGPRAVWPAAVVAAEPVGGAGEAAIAWLRPAGFWRRAVAFLVDLVMVLLLVEIGDGLAGLLAGRDLVARAFRMSFDVVVPTAYFVLLHGTGGQTLGKRLVGVRVVHVSGEPIGYLRALGRELASWLSALLLCLGYLMVAWRRDKRSLHDLLAGTRVVRTRRGWR